MLLRMIGQLKCLATDLYAFTPFTSIIAAEHGVTKAKCSWITLNTRAQASIEYFLPPEIDVDVGLPVGTICRHSKAFLFLLELTDLSHRISIRLWLTFLIRKKKTIIF